VVPETWYTFSEKNKMMAEQAMAESQRLREAIFHAIEQTSNDLRSIFIHSYQYIYTYCKYITSDSRYYKYTLCQKVLDFLMQKTTIICN
jgi:hypothetical protein